MSSSRAEDATLAPLISNEQIRQLYIALVRGQMLRERNRLKRTSAALVAREAIVTGSVANLTAGDVVMPAFGDQVAALARGHRLRRVLAGALLPGVLPAAPTAAAQFAIATGYAMARKETSEVTLVFSGPGVAMPEDLGPVLAYAMKHKAGVVFVLETIEEIHLGTETHGVCTIPVDGNDVIAIYRVAQEAIARARRGVGPTVVDCKPWPRSIKTGESSDPVRRLEQALARRGIEVVKLRERIVAVFRRELAAAVNRGRS